MGAGATWGPGVAGTVSMLGRWCWANNPALTGNQLPPSLRATNYPRPYGRGSPSNPASVGPANSAREGGGYSYGGQTPRAIDTRPYGREITPGLTAGVRHPTSVAFHLVP